MAPDPRKARDLDLLDAVDALPREPFDGRVWRTVREGRDPSIGSPSEGRWSNGLFDVLYTSLEKNGSIAEVDALLSQQPVFPSTIRWLCHELTVRSRKTLKIADSTGLKNLGIDATRYSDRRYERTQSIADAAFFLGFDGLIAPSARWSCLNLVLFTGRLEPTDIHSQRSEPVDFGAWRRGTRRPAVE